MILKDTATFQVLFIVSLFCAWNITTVGSTVAFTYLKVKLAKCLFCLSPVVLVLFFGLDFKNLVFLHRCCCFMLVSFLVIHETG